MSWLIPLILSLGSAFGILIPWLRPIGFELLLASIGFLAWVVVAVRYPASFSLTRFAPMSVFLTTHTLMIVLPSLHIRMAFPEIGGAAFFPAVLGVIPLSIIGWWVVMRGLGVPRAQFSDYFEAPTDPLQGRVGVTLWLALVGLCIGLAGLHVSVAPVNPLKALIAGASSMELALMREASFKTLPLPGIKYLLSWLMSVLFPFAVIWAASRAILIQGWRWKLIFIPTLGTALAYATFTLAKAPAAMLIGMLFIVYFAVRGVRVPVLTMFFGGLVVLMIPAVLVSMISDAGPVATMMGLIRRLFFVPAEALVFYFEAFDAEHPFLNGRSINLLARSLDDSAPFPIANYIFHIIHPDGIETGLSNASFIGTMWANFSYIGLVAGPLFVGAFIALSELAISYGSKDAFKVTLHAIVCLQVFFLSSRSITVAMLTGGWVPAIALALAGGWFLRRLASTQQASEAT